MFNNCKSALVYSGLFILVFGILATGTLQADKKSEGIAQAFRWRNIGPANMSGRISDIEALNDDFTHVLVASASGGVWKSTNGGITWKPIFDDYSAASIGDIALCQSNPDIIWVGTGEKNPRNSIAWGDGIYKSADGGKTFANMGLKDTHSIAKVIIHPDNPDIVYAAAAGHLWGYSGDRGLFKTEDGGTTWTKLTTGLPEGDTGKIGRAVCLSKPDILMAFVEHGFHPPEKLPDGKDNPEYKDMTKLGSGLYRSEDGGETWTYVNRYYNRPFYYNHIFLNPVDDQIVYILTTKTATTSERTAARP